MPIGGSNTRKSKLHDRARLLFTRGLKETLADKGFHYKWVPAPVSGMVSKGGRANKGASRQEGDRDNSASKGAKAKAGDGKGMNMKGFPKGAGPAGKGAAPADAANGLPDERLEATQSKVIRASCDLDWLFINTRVTFE
eukprot:10931987-Karenia_brevis.AAC.1